MDILNKNAQPQPMKFETTNQYLLNKINQCKNIIVNKF